MGGEWMIGKFATASVLLLVLTLLLGVEGFAQGTPAASAPAVPPATPTQNAQQPSAKTPDTSQEPAEEDTIGRRVKPKDYKNWSYNVGFGANIDSGATKTFVRGGGLDGTVGVARNANKYLGLRADFIFENLPLRDSTLELAQATGATSYALDFTLDPIINIPVTKLYSGYILFGPGFFRRAGTLNGDTAIPGSGCNSFWTWWGACSSVSIPLNNSFVSSSQNEFGYNFGAGVARKMPSGAEVYLEYRIMHGSANNTTTDTRPITIGVRW
jgi:opacity protein-like surface antigen